MTTIDTSGRPAFMYDEDTETWYAISGRVSTSANYVWTGAQQFTNNVRTDGALTATLRFNSFLNPAARATAIPSPGIGLITFIQQDAGGNTINRFEFWNGSAWTTVVPVDTVTLDATQTLTNKTLTSPVIISASATGGTITDASIISSIFTSPEETVTVSASAATGTINFDCLTNTTLFYTLDATANFTLNFRGNSSTTLNSILSNGQSITCLFLNTNGATAFYPTAFQIDGSAITPKWSGGSEPTSGKTNSINAYSFSIIKTGASTYTVLAGTGDFA